MASRVLVDSANCTIPELSNSGSLPGKAGGLPTGLIAVLLPREAARAPRSRRPGGAPRRPGHPRCDAPVCAAGWGELSEPFHSVHTVVEGAGGIQASAAAHDARKLSQLALLGNVPYYGRLRLRVHRPRRPRGQRAGAHRADRGRARPPRRPAPGVPVAPEPPGRGPHARRHPPRGDRGHRLGPPASASSGSSPGWISSGWRRGTGRGPRGSRSAAGRSSGGRSTKRPSGRAGMRGGARGARR